MVSLSRRQSTIQLGYTRYAQFLSQRTQNSVSVKRVVLGNAQYQTGWENMLDTLPFWTAVLFSSKPTLSEHGGMAAAGNWHLIGSIGQQAGTTQKQISLWAVNIKPRTFCIVMLVTTSLTNILQLLKMNYLFGMSEALKLQIGQQSIKWT